MKVLIIEDDQTLAKNLRQVLTKDGFAVDVSSTREDGLAQTEINEYDCVVLDINLPARAGLPDGSGFDLLADLRKAENKTPVIIVTARGQVEDRIKGLNLGADDYVPKPADSNELTARIRAVIRRNSQSALPILTIGDLVVKPAEHVAAFGKNTLDLTAKEFAVLEYLAQHNGQIITRTMLMEHIWGSDFETFSNVIDVYIRNLRRKLEKHSKVNLIETIRGKGYILRKYEK
ncbi:DNA-binding response regulator [Candidatus Roizmanbacteria bacterium CG10_big_fil_rev_8_21_14_0_10_39_6]|uniref:DNA-binding response regulator n=1 Tax=Candidatus Roizmanbacteria bacterium CG10_big_fil_rev_8_21_14_0_10_39_6 TaxID=1974853 RepID=A0A2M8KQX4_9BACT|nr:MAG: DNA-binding response regulator [Candidatus Roizmanbacteria bacterium CG10_big_fil_rev_8_21_14_0_10_39_6]